MISKNKIKYIRSLELKKNRNKEGKFVAEGFKVVDDLLALQPADLIVATGEWLRGKHFGAETEVIEVTDEELKKVSFLQHPQQVLAVFRQATSGDYSINTSELSLALDGVSGPGQSGHHHPHRRLVWHHPYLLQFRILPTYTIRRWCRPRWAA